MMQVVRTNIALMLVSFPLVAMRAGAVFGDRYEFTLL